MSERILLLYPPGPLYQRGEDRCQSNIEGSSATSMRACNDLGYAAAVLLERGYEVRIRDYQTERVPLEAVKKEFAQFAPDLIMVSVTNATIYSDLEFVKELVVLKPATVVLKGAIFFDSPVEILDEVDFSVADYLVGGEIDSSIASIADYALRGEGSQERIPGVLYKDHAGEFIGTQFDIWCSDLDEVPFPARALMNNGLYVRPDTGAPMATIQTSRGCSGGCIYCLSPTISGRKIRYRSAQNVFDELVECYEQHGIKDFFFKADTFTMDAQWVEDLCNLIMKSPLAGKIAFTANSRVKPLKKETLQAMRDAGCFAVALGYESGSDETLEKIHKGARTSDNARAAQWAREVGLPVYGFFIVGFPWEDESHLKATRDHIFNLKPDFLELHIALPYYGTKFYEVCAEAGVLDERPLGKDYFESSIVGTQHLTMERILEYRNEVLRSYYLRPSYIVSRISDIVRNPKALGGYVSYGVRLLGNLFSRSDS